MYKKKDFKQYLFEEQETQKCQTDQYLQFFKDIKIQNYQEQIQLMYFQLAQKGFYIDPNAQNIQNQFSKIQNDNFMVNITRKTTDQEIVQVQCQLGIYKKKFIIFNDLNSQSATHQLVIQGYGGSGNVYLYQNSDEKYTIKCIKFNQKNENQIYLIKFAIKEYFIMSMMSALKIGPLIKSQTGFDIILSEYCLQFSMEKCQHLQVSEMNQKTVQTLKQSLRKMHILKIIHFDIKPSNIMMSQSFKKAVFIDYGVSDLIKQNLGQKTSTLFKGTVGYCSKQMLECLISKRQINLYLNDIVSLLHTKQFFEIQYCKNSPPQKNICYEQRQIFKLYDQKLNQNKKLKVKFLLFQQELQKVIIILQNIKFYNQNLFSQILKQTYQFLKYQMSQNQSEQFHTLDNQASYMPFITYFRQYQFSIQFHFFQNFQKAQRKNRYQFFQNIFKKLSTYKNPFNSFVFKNKIKQILLKENQQIQPNIYFQLLIKFLSFSRNYFQVDLNEKYEVAQNFLKNYKPLLKNDLQINQQIFEKWSNFKLNQTIFSKKLLTVKKCISHLIYISYQNFSQKIFQQVYISLIRQSVFLNFNFFQVVRVFLQKLIISQTNLLKKILDILTLYFEIFFVYSKMLKQVVIQRFQTFQNQSSFLQSIIQTMKKVLKLQQNCKIKNIFYDQFSTQIQKYFLSNLNSQLQFKSISDSLQNLIQIFQKRKETLNSVEIQMVLQILNILIQNNKKNVFFAQGLQEILTKDSAKKLNLKQKCQFKRSYSFKIQSLLNLQFLNFKLQDKIKPLIKDFDKAIKCSQISNNFFIHQRFKTAFIQLDLLQLKKIIQKICNENAITLNNQNPILNAFLTFANISLSKVFEKIQIKQLYDPIKKWMFVVLNKFILLFFVRKQNQVNIKYFAIFLFKLCRAYYRFIGCSQQNIEQNEIFLLQNVNKKLQKIDNLFFQQSQRKYILCMLEYYQRINKSYQKQIQLFTKIVKSKVNKKNVSSSKDYDNFNLILRVIFIKLQVQGHHLFNWKQYLILDKIIKKKVSFYFQNCYQVIRWMIYSLLVCQMFIQLASYLKCLTDFLKKYPSQVNSRQFIQQVELVFNKKCGCQNCSKKLKSVNQFVLFLQNNLERFIFKFWWQNAYFSIILINIFWYFNPKNYKQLQKFLCKSCFYVDEYAKDYIISSYYSIKCRLYQQYSNKYWKYFKKYVKMSKIYINIKHIVKIYFKKRVYILINIHTQKIRKKIVRYYQINQNILIQKKINKIVQKKDNQQKQQQKQKMQMNDIKTKLQQKKKILLKNIDLIITKLQDQY